MYSPTCAAPDPIHEENGQFYFWDETWSERHGPFGTRNQATQKLGQYLVHLEYGHDLALYNSIENREQEEKYRKDFIAKTFRNSLYLAVILTLLYICFLYRDHLFEVKDSLLTVFQQASYFFRDWFVDGTNAARKLIKEVL